MKTVQRIAKNTGVLLGANVLSKILLFFYVMYAVRHLGVKVFGVLSLAIAFTEIFRIVADFGLSSLTVREVARDKSLASKYLRNVAVMKMFLAGGTFGLIGLLVNLLGYPGQTIRVVYVVALSVIFAAFTGMFDSIFRAFERMEYVSLGLLLKSVAILGGGMLAVRWGFGVLGFALLYSAAAFVLFVYGCTLLMWKFSRVLFKRRKNILEIDWSFWKQCIREAWPMGAMAVCILLYFRIDTLMLSLMKGDAAVGLYSVAYRVSELSTILPAMFVLAVFPVMAKHYKDSTDSFVKTYAKSVKYLVYLAFPVALIVTLLGRPIVELLFGEECSGSVAALKILIWAAAIMYVTMVIGHAFLAANKQVTSLKLTIAAVVLNVTLNLIVIPRYGYVGASVTTVTTEAFGLFAGMFMLNKYGYKLGLASTFLGSIIGFLIAAVTAVILIALDINILLVSGIVLVVYGGIVYRIGVKAEDKRLLREVFSLLNLRASQVGSSSCCQNGK